MQILTDKQIRDLAQKHAEDLGERNIINEQDAAALAVIFRAGVYKNLDTGPGSNWIEIDIADNDSGYDALSLYHVKSRTLVFVNRGAEGWGLSKDFLAGAAASFGARVKPLRECIDFAADSHAYCVKRGLEVENILCTGVSWGGALTDCQATLLPGLVGIAPERVRGVGFASAGFQDAISAIAEEKNLPVAGARDRIIHRIRVADPIRLVSFTGYFGTVRSIGSVFLELQEQAHKSNVRWYFKPDALQNHSGLLYYHYFDQVPKGSCLAIDRDQEVEIVARDQPN